MNSKILIIYLKQPVLISDIISINKKMNHQGTQETLCEDIKAHQMNVRFCITCFDKRRQDKKLFFCTECNHQVMRSQHYGHQVQRINSKVFKQHFQIFKQYIRNNCAQSQLDWIVTICSPQFHLNSAILNYQFRKSITQSRFWNFYKKDERQSAIVTLSKITIRTPDPSPQNSHKQTPSPLSHKQTPSPLSHKQTPSPFSQKQTSSPLTRRPVPKQQSLSFLVDWSSLTHPSKETIFKDLHEGSEIEKDQLIERNQTLQKIQQIYQKFAQNSGENTLQRIFTSLRSSSQQIDLVKMVITNFLYCSLHITNARIIDAKIIQICQKFPNFKDSDICLYLQSFKYWKNLPYDNNEEYCTHNLLFADTDPFDSQLFIIENPKQYIKILNNIISRNEGKDSGIILNMCKAFGYLSMNQFKQANKCLNLSLIQSQSTATGNIDAFLCICQNFPVNKYPLLLRHNQFGSKDSNFYQSLLKLRKQLQNGSYWQGREDQNIFMSEKNPLWLKIYFRNFSIVKNSMIAAFYQANNLHEKVNESKRIVNEGDKHNWGVYFNLAYFLYENGEYKAANEQIDRALAIQKSKRCLKLKIKIQLSMGKLREVKELLNYFKEGQIQWEIVRQIVREQ